MEPLRSSSGPSTAPAETPGPDVVRTPAVRFVVLWLLCAGAVAGCFIAATRIGRLYALDNAVIEGRSPKGGKVADLAERPLDTISATALGAAIVVVGVIALIRRRPRLALMTGAIMGMSVITTEILKKSMGVLDLTPYRYSAFPSGHTTVAAAVGVGFVIVLPDRWRGAAAIGGWAYTATIAVGTLAIGAHRPSEAVGAQLVTLGWASLALGVLVLWRGARRDEGADRSGAVAPLVTAMLVLTVIAIAATYFGIHGLRTGEPVVASTKWTLVAGSAVVSASAAGAMLVLLGALRGIVLDPSPDADHRDGGSPLVGITQPSDRLTHQPSADGRREH